MAVTGAHNRAFLQARVGSRVINRGKSLGYHCKGLKPVFNIRSALTVGVHDSCILPLIILYNRTFFRASELFIATYVRAKQYNTYTVCRLFLALVEQFNDLQTAKAACTASTKTNVPIILRTQ